MIHGRFAFIAASCFALSAMQAAAAHTVAETPNLQMTTSGSVFDVLVEPDGHIIVAGKFEVTGGLPRKNLARLNPDGSTDTSWALDTNGTVYSVAQSSTGDIYVAGAFSNIGGLARNGIARIRPHPDGAAVDAWVPSEIYAAEDVEVAADDDVYVLDNDRVLRFPAGGTLPDPEWSQNQQLAPPPWDIAVSSDGMALTTCSSSGWVERLTRTGVPISQLDWDGYCNEIAFAPDGSIFVARWLEAETPARGRQVISRILPSGQLDAAWEREVGPSVDSFAFLPSGDVWVGTSDGRVVGLVNSSVGYHRDGHGRLFRFHGNGMPFGADEPEADSNYEILEVLPAGDVLAGGSFKIIDHERRDALATLDPDTAAVGPPMIGVQQYSHSISAMLKLPDGGFLVSGPFTTINGQSRRMLASLTPDFQVKPDAWDLDRVPIRMVLAEAGDCFLGGLFPLSANSPSTLLKLSRCAVVDANWQPEVRGLVSALSTDGTMLHAASCFDFSNYFWNDCRLQQFPMSGTGSVAATWTLPIAGGINALLHESGALYAAGAFSEVDAQPRSGVAKLSSATGVVDPNWIAERTPRIALSLASAGDGEIIVSGHASTTGPRPALIRLNTQSGGENLTWRPWASLSPSFAAGAMAMPSDRNLYFAKSGYGCCVQRTPASGSVDGVESNWTLNIDGRIDSIVPGGPGELLVAGTFSRVDGVERNGLARLTDVHPVLFVDQFE